MTNPDRTTVKDFLPITQIIAIWLGFVIVVGTMSVGGALSQSASLTQVVTLVLSGNLILGLLAAIGGFVGAHSGQSFAQLASRAFGVSSGRLISLYVPIILTFWFAVLGALVGSVLCDLIGLNENLRVWLQILSCLVMASSAYLGIRGIAKLSLILVPLIFIVASWAMAQRFESFQQANKPLSFTQINQILGLVLSTWIMGAMINLPDITRFCRSPKQGALVGFVGIFVGNSFNLILGATAAVATGSSNPSDMLAALGLPVIGVVLLIANVWSTNDNNMYSASLGISEATGLKNTHAVILCTLAASILCIFNPTSLETVMKGVIWMGSTAPALGAVVLASYLGELRGFRSSPIGAWMGVSLGIATALAVNGAIGIVVSILMAALTWGCVTYFAANKRALF
jgi:cytosine permease